MDLSSWGDNAMGKGVLRSCYPSNTTRARYILISTSGVSKGKTAPFKGTLIDEWKVTV